MFENLETGAGVVVGVVVGVVGGAGGVVGVVGGAELESLLTSCISFNFSLNGANCNSSSSCRSAWRAFFARTIESSVPFRSSKLARNSFKFHEGVTGQTVRRRSSSLVSSA